MKVGVRREEFEVKLNSDGMWKVNMKILKMLVRGELLKRIKEMGDK